MNYCVKPAAPTPGSCRPARIRWRRSALPSRPAIPRSTRWPPISRPSWPRQSSQFECSSKPTDDKAAKTLMACDSSVDVDRNDRVPARPDHRARLPDRQRQLGRARQPGGSDRVAGEPEPEGIGAGELGEVDPRPQHRQYQHHRRPTSRPAVASGTPCADFVAFTLDGAVVSDAGHRTTINGSTPDQRWLHPVGRQSAGPAAELRRAAAELRRAEQEHGLGDARQRPAQGRPARRRHRPDPRRDLLADLLPRRWAWSRSHRCWCPAG